MGRAGELLVIFAIVFLLFGTKRLKNFGGDLGAAIKGFKQNIADDSKSTEQTPQAIVLNDKLQNIPVDAAKANAQI